MNCNEIINELRTLGSEKYKNNVVKMGIPEECSLGVSTTDVRKLSKKIGKSQQLACELWETGYHEAKLLSVLLMEKNKIILSDVEKMMGDVKSWDLCDHYCKNLILGLPDYQLLIKKWCNHQGTYYKRGAYTLMASAVIHDKKLKEDVIDEFLEMIQSYSDDDRIHVKKAISWALREIGKKDFAYQEKAIMTAYELKESSSKSKVWVAKDAIKELETLVQAEGRGRLITSGSQMGREQEEEE